MRIALCSQLLALWLTAAPTAGAVKRKKDRYEIKACVDKKTGVLRRVDWLKRCTSRESGVRWNSDGPVGAPGVPGVPGVQGARGIQGAKGDTGDQGGQGMKGDTGEGCTVTANTGTGAGTGTLACGTTTMTVVDGNELSIAVSELNARLANQALLNVKGFGRILISSQKVTGFGAQNVCRDIYSTKYQLFDKTKFYWLSSNRPVPESFTNYDDYKTQPVWALMDGTIVAYSLDDLLDPNTQLKSLIDMDENGNQVTGATVWSNLKADGTVLSDTNHCDYWRQEDSSLSGSVGNNAYLTKEWTEGDGSARPCNEEHHVYCLFYKEMVE